MTRRSLSLEVTRLLGKRRLIWAGVRADDAAMLAELPNYAGSFSILDSCHDRLVGEGQSYEQLSKERVDLETWDIQDQLRGGHAAAFRTALLKAATAPSALVTYRPSEFLSSALLARIDSCLSLSPFGAHQAAIEHKPWVESQLRSMGIDCIPWRYVADEDFLRAQELLDEGPIVIRRSRTSGGEGMVRVSDPSLLLAEWPRTDEGLASIAPYLEDGLPVNVGAVAWGNEVTVHHPSVQLVGLPSCVERPFGYCGNDFGAVTLLGSKVIDEIERTTKRIGRWLGSIGYRGAYGVDFLLHEGRLLFTEVNARFQGSTLASSRLSAEADEACLYLEHIACFLGIRAPTRPKLRDLVQGATPLSQVVVHAPTHAPASVDPTRLLGPLQANLPGTSLHVDVLTQPTFVTNPGAVVARISARESVTRTGYDIDSHWLTAIEAWRTGIIADSETRVDGGGKSADQHQR